MLLLVIIRVDDCEEADGDGGGSGLVARASGKKIQPLTLVRLELPGV